MLSSATAAATIAVSDLGRARMFYEETLGLKPLDEMSDGVRYETGRGTWLLVYPSGSAGTNQATWMTFIVDDVEKEVAELRERGVVFEEYDFPGLKTVNGIADIQGERSAWFKDLDGNILAVAEQS
jgi:catechol 2,3-dioxygenase-like lactoylglutathione lyase family enzyme